MADPIDSVCGKVHFDVAASGFHDQTDHRTEQHERKAFDATENIDEL